MSDKTLEYIRHVNSLRDADRPKCPEKINGKPCVFHVEKYSAHVFNSRLKLITYIDPKSKIGVVDWECYQCGYQAPLHRHTWVQPDEVAQQ